MNSKAETKIKGISAFILAAGRGTRMYPYSKVISKPLLPILNEPILIHTINRLLEAGIEDIGVVVSKKELQIPKIIQKKYPEEKFQYVIQKDPLGTGHAVLQLENTVKTENFVVVAGDSLFSSIFFRDICLHHIDNNYSATLSLEKMDFKKMRYSSTVDYQNNRVWSIREKPKTKRDILSNLNSAACYVFSSTVFDSLKHIEKSERNEYELASAINHIIKSEHAVGGKITDKVYHISNSFDLWKINLDYLKTNKLKDMNGNLISETAIINPKAELSDSIVGENSTVDKNVKLERTVILPDSVVSRSYKDSLVLSEHAETFN